MKTTVLLLAGTLLGLLALADTPAWAAGKLSDDQLRTVRDGFDERVKQVFEAQRGQPLVRAAKREPLGTGRGNFVRAYSWSMVEFATRCFALNEQIDQANAALVENARHYLDHPKDINDRDSFHWHADVVCRLIELYGPRGSLAAGRLTAETEAIALEPMWTYATQTIHPYETEFMPGQGWKFSGSDNHHVMDFTAKWHFAKLAKDHPKFRDRKYPDGSTASAQYVAWNQYLKTYCLERAKKGLFTELASNYNAVGTKGFYNLYDFADDPILKRRMGYLLDLHWAMWAQEQIDGVRGGGKTRLYQSGGDRLGNSEVRHLAWFFFGIGEPPHKALGPHLTALNSTYRPPLVVIDLALDVAGRGRYEVLHRPMGLADNDFAIIRNEHLALHAFTPTGGGLVCYSWCTQDFILGTPMVEPRPSTDWVPMSGQNRWHGVIFSGDLNARIVPQVRAKDDRTVYNAQWSVQRKGTLICQKLKTNRGGQEMRVWFSQAGLSNRLEENSWIFVEAPAAYAAVRVVSGTTEWFPTQSKKSGLVGAWLQANDEWTPVILEVGCKEDFTDYAAFRKAVAALPVALDSYTLLYKGLSGHKFTFYTDQSRVPQIDGKAVDYSPPMVLDSPFVKAAWNDGMVTITKDGREVVLDFKQE